jgi:hypothetical protein
VLSLPRVLVLVLAIPMIACQLPRKVRGWQARPSNSFTLFLLSGYGARWMRVLVSGAAKKAITEIPVGVS